MQFTPLHRLAVLAMSGVAAIGIGCLDARAASAASVLKAPADLSAEIPSPFKATSTQPAGTYIGRLNGNPSGFAAIVRGERVLFYWCDSKEAGDWFGGTNVKGSLVGSSAKGITVNANLAAGRISGTLTRNGESFKFTLASAASAGAGAGVYRTTEVPGGAPGAVLGWIVLKDQVIGATNNPDGSVSGAVPMAGNCNGSDCGKIIGGGCLRRRIALRLSNNAQQSNPTPNGGAATFEQIDAALDAGCSVQGLGLTL